MATPKSGCVWGRRIRPWKASRFDRRQYELWLHVEQLILQETDVTDAELQQLAPLKTSRKVYLNGTNVTASGMTALKIALPQREVTQIIVE
jgi:hypothetical protein